MKDLRKVLPRTWICLFAFLLLLCVLGMLAGSGYAIFSDEGAAQNPLQSWISDKEISLTAIYSGFLFEFIFYLAVVFLFGMTFLGTVIIPAAVILKGLTLGISFSYLLISQGLSAYLLEWSICLPAAFGLVVFLLFSAYANCVSLKFFRSLRDKGAAAVSLKSYCLLFFLSLLILAAAGVLHCGLYLLSVILY